MDEFSKTSNEAFEDAILRRGVGPFWKLWSSAAENAYIAALGLPEKEAKELRGRGPLKSRFLVTLKLPLPRVFLF